MKILHLNAIYSAENGITDAPNGKNNIFINQINSWLMNTKANEAVKVPYTQPSIEETSFQVEAGIAMSISTDPNQGAIDFTVVGTWDELRRDTY